MEYTAHPTKYTEIHQKDTAKGLVHVTSAQTRTFKIPTLTKEELQADTKRRKKHHKYLGHF